MNILFSGPLIYQDSITLNPETHSILAKGELPDGSPCSISARFDSYPKGDINLRRVMEGEGFDVYFTEKSGLKREYQVRISSDDKNAGKPWMKSFLHGTPTSEVTQFFRASRTMLASGFKLLKGEKLDEFSKPSQKQINDIIQFPKSAPPRPSKPTAFERPFILEKDALEGNGDTIETYVHLFPDGTRKAVAPDPKVPTSRHHKEKLFNRATAQLLENFQVLAEKS